MQKEGHPLYLASRYHRYAVVHMLDDLEGVVHTGCFCDAFHEGIVPIGYG
jgi:hypothetical protein